jgi:UDP-N-acetylglucosamine--N-acetylmuramyl-(pentapeptide) pyrophosphoryl-undecaprenol N-acetylglucosamine transferase
MRWIIAGGGTGGHLYPGIAIAQELKRQSAGADILFVGHGRGLADDILKREGFEFKGIEVAKIKGQSIGGMLRAGLGLPLACWQSRQIVYEFDPRVVLGVGGYSSGPVVLAAALMNRACYIQEQNVYPGLTNRILARWVDKIFTSYQASADFFPPDKVLFTGNPVRAQVGRLPARAGALQRFGLSRHRFTVLVFGGSQGAHQINSGMIGALPHLAEAEKRLQIIHQTGRRDYAQVSAAYEQSGIKAHVSPFIYDMPTAYAAADMVICRAGATTLAEITAAGKPALLIPYPYAANDHQRKNAQVLEKEGAARIMADDEVNGKGLARVILELMADRGKLEQMAQRSKRVGRPDAARRIVEYILAEVG